MKTMSLLVVIILASITGCSGGGGSTNPVPGPTVSINNPIASEGGVAVFVITLNGTSDKPVTFDWKTAVSKAGISATADLDYVAVQGRDTIPSGRTLVTDTIIILSDQVKLESDEVFDCVLSNIKNAKFADSVGTATILEATAGLPSNAVSPRNTTLD